MFARHGATRRYTGCINSLSRVAGRFLRSPACLVPRMDDTASTPSADPIDVINAVALTRLQARRLRDIHRSAGWPSQDALEIELLAAGWLQRVMDPGASERLRLTDAGIQSLARALQRNRQALSAHDALVDKVAQRLLRDGRLVWTGLSLRARLLPEPDTTPVEAAGAAFTDLPTTPTQSQDFVLGTGRKRLPPARWKICRPDVFSIRNTSVSAYLQPVVHEIKVSRADLLGDLRLPDKRKGYLDLGGQCWYVLGCDTRGRPIAQAHEVPGSCGVMVVQSDGQLVVARHAPQRAMADLPFALWMALAKATPLATSEVAGVDGDPDQALLDAPPSMQP